MHSVMTSLEGAESPEVVSAIDMPLLAKAETVSKSRAGARASSGRSMR